MSELEIFAAAIEQEDPILRAAYLDEACEGRPELRERIEDLLKFHGRSQSLMERSPLALFGSLDSVHPEAELLMEHQNAEASWQSLLTPSSNPDSIGMLGHYEIREKLGVGGYGTVFKAKDTRLDRIVAIKILSHQLAATSPPRKRFLREARLAASVKHDNVVQIYAVEDEPSPYIVMEFVAGETLQQRLMRTGPAGFSEVIQIGHQIASGLAAAHDRGVIHRDIKPDNILLEADPDLQVKLSDFGLARTIDDSSMTQSGQIIGTPLYMSPEQIRGGSLDHRTDLFSLGSVLYTICGGHPPFRATNTMAVLRRVTDDKPRPLSELIPETPDGLCAVIEGLLAKQPDDRPDSAREVADLLLTCLDSSRTARILRRRRSSRATGRLSRIAVLLLVVVVATLFAVPSTRATFFANFSTADRSPQPLQSEIVTLDPPTEEMQPASAIDDLNRTADTAEQQVTEVIRQLMELNPELDRSCISYKIEEGVVANFFCIGSRGLTNISPIRQLTDLTSASFAADYRAQAATLTSLAPLEGLPLQHLHLAHQAATDLTPLADMPLEILVLWDWKGTDISPLANMPLRDLTIGYSPLSNIEPLRDLSLELIILTGTSVEDLSPLEGMPLRTLQINQTQIADLSPVASCPLETLYMQDTRVRDFSNLSLTNLQQIKFDDVTSRMDQHLALLPNLVSVNSKPVAEFWADDSGPAGKWEKAVADLSARDQAEAVRIRLNRLNPELANDSFRATISDGEVTALQISPSEGLRDLSPLRVLHGLKDLSTVGATCDISDLNAIQDMNLTRLSIIGSAIEDLSELRGMPLEDLTFWQWLGDDLSPLKGMPLTHANFGSSPVTDLTPLSEMPLRTLVLNHTQVRDLSPLAETPLTELLLQNTPTEDLSPLQSVPLEVLHIGGSPVVSLEPLKDTPLRIITLDYDAERDRDVLRSLPHLESINGTPVEEFFASLDVTPEQ